MSDILRIRTLTDRFFDGTTTLEEEQELYDYYRHEQALPADLAQLRRLFLDFAAVEFADEPAAERQAPAPRRWLRWAVAACAALTIAAGAAVWLNSGRQGDDERIERMMAVVSTLPDLQQTILRLRHLEGLEMNEIADLTGSSEVAIRKALSRARQAVRQKYMKQYE